MRSTSVSPDQIINAQTGDDDYSLCGQKGAGHAVAQKTKLGKSKVEKCGCGERGHTCMYAIGAREEVFDVVKEDTHVCMR